MKDVSIEKIFLLLCMLFISSYGYAFLSDDISGKQSQLKNINQQIQALKKTISATQWQETDLQDQLKISELKIDLISNQMEALNLDLKKAEFDLNKSKISQQNSLKQLAEQRQLLAEQIRILYQLGQKQSLKTILNPDDINKIDRHLAYYGYLNQAHVKTISDIKTTLAVINNNLELMTAQEQNLKTLLQQKHVQQQQEINAQARRQSVIDKLKMQLQDKQQQVAALANNQKALQETLDGFSTKPAVFSSAMFDHLKGQLNWPLKGTINGIYARSMANGIYSASESQKLTGVIISAPEGTPVKAISGGKVIFANWLRGFGLLVIINHGDGFMSLYARNHALYAKVGDMVSKNDVIAKIGNSGGYDKSSLYFEIRHNGSSVDPRQWCIA